MTSTVVGAVAAVTHPSRSAPSSTAGEARSDARQRMIVDDAIALLGNSNLMSAFEYLRARNIAVHVIERVLERVLLEPLQRRAAL